MKHGGTERAEVTEPGKLLLERITGSVIGAAIDVHRVVGPGLLESTYEACLSRALDLRGVAHRRQVVLPIEYEGIRFGGGYRVDLVVEEQIVVGLKAVKDIHAVHEAQLMTYLRHSGCRVGLLINFHTRTLRDGILRRVL